MSGSLLRRVFFRKCLAFALLCSFVLFLGSLKLISICCRVELTRHVSMISITLSLTELNKDSPG